MIVKTKKYQLEPNTYVRVAMRNLLSTQWWVPVAIFFGVIVLNLLLNLVYSNLWIYFFAPIGAGLYFLFWYIQFYGATKLEQHQIIFERYSYEIDSRAILMKVNSKEGMQIQWNMIQSAKKEKDHYLLVISKGQFIYLPFKIFNSDNDLRFFESILKRKQLLAEAK
ncbi:YcxB family protein [Eisenibacter elegans]|jgi:hypothetical protein|uniref:YcxB family protein n=1 Tax=Eisenibacter elegans TaxID=997 RepID=UPI000425D37E|nr:YcxB family protein [Eisenibacter elegans]